MASGEYVFIPGGPFSNYRTFALQNAFLALHNYLYLVPELVAHYTKIREDTLEKCEINGGLYGIPQYISTAVSPISEGFFFREDLRKEWGLEPITDLITMEKYLYRAKEDERYSDYPLITDNRVWTCLWSMLTKGAYLEVISLTESPFVVVDKENIYEPILRMETEAFKEVLIYIQKWYQDGIIDSNILSSSDNEGERAKALMVADKKPCETNSPIWAVDANYIPELYQEHPEWEFGFYDYNLDNDGLYINSLAEIDITEFFANEIGRAHV